MSQTVFYCTPPERKKIEPQGSIQQNFVHHNETKKVVSSYREFLKRKAAHKASLRASNSGATAIQLSNDCIVGYAGTNSMTLLDAETPKVAAITLVLPVSAPEPLSSSPGPDDVDTSSSVSAATEASVELASKPTKAVSKRKKSTVMDVPVPIEKLKYLSIAQTAMRYPAFTEKALRHLQAQAENYQRYPKAGLRSNGFINCILRPAGQRKIIISAEKFEQWLAACKV